jgi:hypothetical protein
MMMMFRAMIHFDAVCRLLSMNMSPFALAMLLETLGFFLKTQSLS